MVDRPIGGVHYPRTYAELLAWFSTDADCLDYLDWLRWPGGFTCPKCGSGGGWLVGDGRRMCSACSKRISATAGTVFDRTRTPLTIWFAAAWLLTSQKDGVSALGLQRVLGIGSYQTAWSMLHRLRQAMVRPGRDRLSGVVEMDETMIGGVRPEGKGGRTPGEKILVGIGIERRKPRGFGRCRLAVLPDASTESLAAFLAAYVEPGSTVVTDGWQPYRDALGGTYDHERYVAPGRLAHKLLPGVHRVASLPDRWLLSTHQGRPVDPHVLEAVLGDERRGQPAQANEGQHRCGALPGRHRIRLFCPIRECVQAYVCSGRDGSQASHEVAGQVHCRWRHRHHGVGPGGHT